jgi:hypothetical protein
MNKRSDKLKGLSAALLVQTLLMISPALAEGSTDLVRAEDAIVLVNPMVDDFGQLTVKRLLTCGQRAGLDAHLIQMPSGSVNSNLPGFDVNGGAIPGQRGGVKAGHSSAGVMYEAARSGRFVRLQVALGIRRRRSRRFADRRSHGWPGFAAPRFPGRMIGGDRPTASAGSCRHSWSGYGRGASGGRAARR